MTAVDRYTSELNLPAELAGLEELAHNLWWTWDAKATALMAELDPTRWEDCKHNPVKILRTMQPERKAMLTLDPHFRDRLDDVTERFRAAVTPEDGGELAGRTVAYFCAEYGIHESLSIYSGGLGILAGDHLKSASDLGTPLVAVGLAYRYGYFHQRIGPDGRQAEDYHANESCDMPAALQCDASGAPIRITVPYPGREVVAHVWKIMVGRVALYLLDADLHENSDEDRMITGHLYGGDEDTRVRQEILLGVGGYRALQALGVEPDAFHLNEGHSAFLAVEQLRQRVIAQGGGFDDHIEAVAARNTFTTHTPIAAGNDSFDRGHTAEYLRAILGEHESLLDPILELGLDPPSDPDARFSMTVFAIHGSRHANGVSALHGEVARNMWNHLWPDTALDDTPIGSITNGVHMATWIAPELDRHYRDHLDDDGLSMDDAKLWRTHMELRGRLVVSVRKRLRNQLNRHGARATEVEALEHLLDPDALTIGFARRFAPYKRATLLLSDPMRLARLLNDSERPMQIIMAGKAHPQNEAGKDLMQEIWKVARDPLFRDRLVLVENYNIALARLLVQGVDVWLNTPRRPLEASGTSGMKAAANGALNLSISDGWWCEGYHGDNGWVIGEDGHGDDPEAQDAFDAESLFSLLENDVKSTFYNRDTDGVPRRWTAMMKASVASVVPEFSSARMVDEYASRYYAPCADV